MKILLCLALVAASYALPSVEVHPLSDEFIDIINSKQSTWTAGRNFHVNTSLDYIRGLSGVIRTSVKTLPVRVHEVGGRETIPESFDAREQWSDCAAIIGAIRDQGSCGSCWALGAVEAMSDRICIHSNGQKKVLKVLVSAQDLFTCCTTCGVGCNGGLLGPAWIYWAENGITTGGLYGETQGCKAYSIEPCAHHVDDSVRPACTAYVNTPACVRECDSDELNYKDELTFGKKDSIYQLPDDETQIQLEIMTNGPVEAAIDVYEDFWYYKSGVYQNVAGNPVSAHAIKILGWGVENDTPYWLVANSWNTDWGDNGYFKILRGSDHVGIESDVVAGLPQL
ncbi:cathepsin B-like [Anoplophora glabripennis]|uniref:cathepsin B-like n=1 Tax=Anoplophora glabripennis TaxID=217634 RepID=UPI000C761983|nr:cathepsin B-like [Anoplophora glabripennis]